MAEPDGSPAQSYPPEVSGTFVLHKALDELPEPPHLSSVRRSLSLLRAEARLAGGGAGAARLTGGRLRLGSPRGVPARLPPLGLQPGSHRGPGAPGPRPGQRAAPGLAGQQAQAGLPGALRAGSGREQAVGRVPRRLYKALAMTRNTVDQNKARALEYTRADTCFAAVPGWRLGELHLFFLDLDERLITAARRLLSRRSASRPARPPPASRRPTRRPTAAADVTRRSARRSAPEGVEDPPVRGARRLGG